MVNRAKTDAGSPAGIPDALSSGSGVGSADMRNPKSQPGSRPDSPGAVPGQGGAALLGSGATQTSTYFDGAPTINGVYKGTGATEPDPADVNRGWSSLDHGVPSVRVNTSANRQRFGIDPGPDVLDPDGESASVPTRPTYGMGATSE